MAAAAKPGAANAARGRGLMVTAIEAIAARSSGRGAGPAQRNASYALRVLAFLVRLRPAEHAGAYDGLHAVMCA